MYKMLKASNLPRSLSAKFESDFAYPTVKDRLPIILTKVVDTVYRMKSEVLEKIGEVGVDDLKSIVGHLSRLKNEVQTNKVLTILEDDQKDVQLWNAYLDADSKVQQMDGGRAPSWFQSSWLYVECYFYRRIMSAIALSTHLKTFDPFEVQKQTALVDSLPAISTLASYIMKHLKLSNSSPSSISNHELFLQLFYVALWGNKCDLSISAGSNNSQMTDPLAQLELLQPHILCDETDATWHRLSDRKKPVKRVDIVLDNAGFELFTDLCLADFLVARLGVDTVHFHAKTVPWFVSDVTPNDWEWMLEKLSSSEDAAVAWLGRRWKELVAKGSWKLQVHPFWTLPQDFEAMETVAPDLFLDLTSSGLILFKGDLNYRKLCGDLKWTPTTPFRSALRGFCPAPLCTLRTLKCDLVVGLEEGVAEKAAEESKDWMLTGSFAVVQFVS